jgi:hypothetical protein
MRGRKDRGAVIVSAPFFRGAPAPEHNPSGSGSTGAGDSQSGRGRETRPRAFVGLAGAAQPAGYAPAVLLPELAGPDRT